MSVEHLDLMVDEFKRIKALTRDPEILGLCDRAISNTYQHSPVIVQRDEWEAAYKALRRKLYTLLQEPLCAK